MSRAWLDGKVGLKARDSLGVVTTMLRDGAFRVPTAIAQVVVAQHQLSFQKVRT